MTPEQWHELRSLVAAMRPYVESFPCADFAEMDAKYALLRRLAAIRNDT
jgi:hypothetical protein